MEYKIVDSKSKKHCSVVMTSLTHTAARLCQNDLTPQVTDTLFTKSAMLDVTVFSSAFCFFLVILILFNYLFN